MKVRGLVIIVIAVMGVNACSSVSHKDLRDLSNANPITQREAIERIAAAGGNDGSFAFIGDFWNRGSARQAVNKMVRLFHECEECLDTRLEILSALGALASQVEVPTSILMEAVEDEDATIRQRAVEIVAKAGDRALVPVLASWLQDDQRDAKEKYAVIWALGELGAQESVSILERLLDSDDKYVRYNAYRSLSKIGEVEKRTASRNGGTSRVAALARTTLERYKFAMTKIFNSIERL